jgi:hypothetical protein
MKPRLVNHWPNVKKDNDVIAKKIKEALHEYNSRRSHLGIDTDKLLGIKDDFMLDQKDPNFTNEKILTSNVKNFNSTLDVKNFNSQEDTPINKVIESSAEKSENLFNNLNVLKKEKIYETPQKKD